MYFIFHNFSFNPFPPVYISQAKGIPPFELDHTDRTKTSCSKTPIKEHLGLALASLCDCLAKQAQLLHENIKGVHFPKCDKI